ncbi:MAG: 2-dehydropantoate 2-reductase N-terminal domain-containing protein [Dermatophilaceae bacterium]
MRFVVVGVGAIGGVLAARLVQAGHEVVGVARGTQLAAVRERGLTLATPTGTSVARLPVHGRLSDVAAGADEVVVVATKSQDTPSVVADLVASGRRDTPVFFAQNGVANEPHALRSLGAVYGVVVMAPTTYLRPGEVVAYSSPTTGILDVGRYPGGVDEVAERVAAALRRATFDSRAIPDVRRWKYAKLVTNLGNAVEAVCGPAARPGPLVQVLEAEARGVLDAAGIEAASPAEDLHRRGSIIALHPVDGRRRPGGSTWQSLARGTGVTEVDYLNGEVVMLGRLHGVPTPANALLRDLATDLARRRAAPGAYAASDLLARLR